MNDKEAKRLFTRASIAAIQLGFKSECEDIAQSVILVFLEKGRTGKTVGHCVIDVLRHEYGRKDWGAGSRNVLRCAERLDEEQIKTEPVRERLKDLSFLFNGRSKEIYVLYYKEEWLLKEIAERFSVTEGRVCQVLSEIKKSIMRYFLDTPGSFERE